MSNGSRLAVLCVLVTVWALPGPVARAQAPEGGPPGTAMQKALPPGEGELVGQRRGKAEESGTPRSPDPLPGSVITIGFNNGSAQLTPTATRRLDALGTQLDARSRIRVDGFAWGLGARDAARDLARRRADAVIGYLAAIGIGRDRLSGNASPDAAAPARGVRVTVLYASRDGASRALAGEDATVPQ